MNRRRFLLATVGALPLAGGCLDRSRPDASNPATDEADEPTGTETPTATEDAADHDSRGPVRGESDADLSVEAVEDDENVQFLEDEDAVRYVAGWRSVNREEIEEGEPPEREPVYETTEFDSWGRTQCVSAAAEAAAEHVRTELGTDEVGGGIASGVPGEDLAAVVSTSTTLTREGDVRYETDVAFEALVAATPRTVEATYRLDGQEYGMSVPVYAEHDVLREE